MLQLGQSLFCLVELHFILNLTSPLFECSRPLFVSVAVAAGICHYSHNVSVTYISTCVPQAGDLPTHYQNGWLLHVTFWNKTPLLFIRLWCWELFSYILWKELKICTFSSRILQMFTTVSMWNVALSCINGEQLFIMPLFILICLVIVSTSLPICKVCWSKTGNYLFVIYHSFLYMLKQVGIVLIWKVTGCVKYKWNLVV